MAKKVALWAFIVILLIGLAIAGLHFYLLVSKQGYQLRIGNLNLIRLGTPEVFFPAQFEKSFEPFTAEAPEIRKPRYERNVTYVSEKWGEIIGKDVDTAQEDQYSWYEETRYLCLSPDKYQAPGLDKPIDPVKNLKDYVFLQTGNTIGGISAYDVGLFMFRRDIDTGTPIRFILKNEEINVDGGKDVLLAIVFTKHKSCAKPEDAMADFPSDAPTQ